MLSATGYVATVGTRREMDADRPRSAPKRAQTRHQRPTRVPYQALIVNPQPWRAEERNVHEYLRR